MHPAWSIPVQDIKELQKRGGYGWKAKLIVGWALEREVQDGLTVIDRKGNKVRRPKQISSLLMKILVLTINSSGSSLQCHSVTNCSTASRQWAVKNGSCHEATASSPAAVWSTLDERACYASGPTGLFATSGPCRECRRPELRLEAAMSRNVLCSVGKSWLT